jgi:hypothetical protein
MGPTTQFDFQLLYNDARLFTLVESLDELHNAASEGALDAVTPLSSAELRGWLLEVVYIAQQTIDEIEGHSADQPGLTLVRKPL